MKVHVRWDVTDLTAVDGNLVGKHARSRNLNRVGPVVIVVAESVCKVENSVLGDL